LTREIAFRLVNEGRIVKTTIILAAVALIALGSAGSAEASQWHMRYRQAVIETKGYARETCNELEGCTAYGWGRCIRESPSRFSCIASFFYPGPEEPEEPEPREIECNRIARWGVGRDGFIELKSLGRVRCFYIPKR
jgi:hypothetical protein